MKIALVHELLTMRGGAERTLRVLAAMYPDAPIYTLLYDEKTLGDWFPRARVRVSQVQKRGIFSFDHHLYLRWFPEAAEAWDFSEYDLVISASSAFAHGIITNGKPKHLCYVHSPARYLWDRTHDVLERAGRGSAGTLKRWYLSRLFHRLRLWDSEAADRPDMLLAASETVKRRIELYWRRDSQTVFPPLDDAWFSAPLRKTEGGYYLIVSTLVPYKRIELAIRACNERGVPLRIAGSGPAEAGLRAIAGPTVRFEGYADEARLRDLYAGAKATLFPGEEDFGLVPLESLACGTPVIAYGAGGATETLTPETAEFFPEPTPASLIAAMERAEKKTWDPQACRTRAEEFRQSRFEERIRAAVAALAADSGL
jgi:glycosyltransferase involved in cell wall biosynthesis